MLNIVCMSASDTRLWTAESGGDTDTFIICLCSKCHFSLNILWEIKCFYNKLSAVFLFLKGCYSVTGFRPFLTQPCVNHGGKSNL